MHRIFNLMQRQSSRSRDRIIPVQPLQKTSDPEAAGMREVRAFLKSKSAVSSLSFSSAGGEGVGEEGVAEATTEPPLPRLDGLHNAPYVTSLGSGTKRLALSPCSTAFKTSATCEGRLVGRIVPKEYSEYDTHKPLAQTDPLPFIASLLSWEEQHGNKTNPYEAASDGNGIQKRYQRDKPLLVSDEDSAVVLDLYLLRSAYLDAPQRCGNGCDGRDDQRERLVQSLMSSFEVTRNNSSHKRNLPESRQIRALSSTEVPSPALENVESAVSTVSSRTNGNDGDSCDVSSNNIILLHMNRSSNELVTRTLRRLELSATRKLQSLNPLALQGKCSSNANVRKVTRGKEENLAQIHKATSSKLVLAEEESQCREVDLTGWSNAEILHLFAGHRDCNWAVGLTIPQVIVPWNDGGVFSAASWCEDQDLDGASSTESLFDAVETIRLDVVANPPTLVDIRTYESFAGDIFTGVPLVVETAVIHATRAVVTWFADEQVVLQDSNMYTPTAADIGKTITILVTPTRPDHNGVGHQEAYSYANDVQAFPVMPVVELRADWLRTRSGTRYTQNNLRVATYNILADLYAGREIESHLMYGHCSIEDLVRQRRMPMIIAEVLSYEADIVCLQEVDASIHDSILRPALEANGYQGFYSNKVSSQQEGCSMFWSTATFNVAARDDMRAFPLRSLLALDDDEGTNGGEKKLSRLSTQYFDAKANVKEMELDRWESLSGIHNLFNEHDEVRKVFQEAVGQIVQIVRLTPKRSANSGTKKPESIVVANSHLFYHPMADHIRVLQMYAICHKLDEIRREGLYPDPVLICGDFNSGPLSGAVRLLTHRSVLPHENDCWKYLHAYRWECGDCEYMLDHGYIGNYDPSIEPGYIEEEFVDAHSDEESLDEDLPSSHGSAKAESSTESEDAVQPPAIELPSSFPILASGCLEVPQFTNYATDFIETLDYVFASMPSEREPYGFKPKGEAPMLSEEMVEKYVAMPNEVMPSDHVAVVCDFEWVKNG